MDSPSGQELPLFSPVNLLIAGISGIVLVIVLIFYGTRIFSPGDLSASHSADLSSSQFTAHADFESKCSYCHQSTGKSQAELCMDCHLNVENQLTQGSGVHGQMQGALECRSCHPDHRGRDFDMTAFARQTFDHSRSGFALDERHAQTDCQGCHAAESTSISPDCESCHEEPAVHAGIFPNACGECHQGAVWSEVTWNSRPYDHNSTGFSLALHQIDYDGSSITCQECHISTTTSWMDTGCQNCHTDHDGQFMIEHGQSFGPSCTECHDGVDRMESFDHAAVFRLDGKHFGLSCGTCHTGRELNDSPTVCASCHEEPEIHAGYFGLRCQMCHTSDGWQPARLSIHEFPVDHGEPEESTCTTCHTGAYTEYTCYTCHDHDEKQISTGHAAAGIAEEMIPECSTCHLDGQVHREL